ncbi:MAG TPA: hypothetical protein VIU12_19425 [Chryseolinea sp.]
MPAKKKIAKRHPALPPPFRLTRAGIREVNHLLEFTSPEDLRNTLIEMYHTYIMQQHHALPVNFEIMSGQMFHLLETLRHLQPSEKNRDRNSRS